MTLFSKPKTKAQGKWCAQGQRSTPYIQRPPFTTMWWWRHHDACARLRARWGHIYTHTLFWKMDILHRCRHHHNSHCTHAMLYTRELQATSRVARFQQCHSLNPMQMALGSTSIVATRTYRAAQHYSTSSTRPLNTETIYHFKALSWRLSAYPFNRVNTR